MASRLVQSSIMLLVMFATVASSQTIFDFVSEAHRAQWFNDKGMRLPFPGSKDDNRGFALILPKAVLEDGRSYTNVLETHPRWQPNGTIEGRYSLTVPKDAEFQAKVGFLQGATATDGVTFEVLWRGRTLLLQHKAYDQSLKEIKIDLSSYAGQSGEMVLRVKAGDSAGQDWAVWVEPRIARKTIVGTGQPVFVRIVLDSLYCVKESKYDHGTDSDEPYLLVTAFASHRSPQAWSTGDPEVFSDVDSGENRRFTYANAQRVVFEGEVPPGAVVGFNAVVMEADEGSMEQRRRLARNITEQLLRGPLTGLPEFQVDPITRAITDFMMGNIVSLIDTIMHALGGGADDFVATNTFTASYDQLKRWAQGERCRAMFMDLDGKDEGHYILRWHLEFVREASRSFVAKFTHWDGFAVGNVLGSAEPEIVIVVDEDASGDDGKFYIYDRQGHLLRTWNGFYTHYDRIVIGDVLGDALEEIIVASDDGGGQIRIYDGSGNKLRHFAAPFTKYDGLAVGNVMGDAKAEIVIARDDDRQVFIYNAEGQRLRAFMVDAFSGCRYTADAESNRHDGFAVGDVLGDGYAEILIAINRNGSDSTVFIFDASGRELRKFNTFFTHCDGFILADIFGDAKKEIVIAVDGGDGRAGFTIYATEVRTNTVVIRHWPLFTKYDGLAASDLNGDGKDEILLATDEDSRVYIGM